MLVGGAKLEKNEDYWNRVIVIVVRYFASFARSLGDFVCFDCWFCIVCSLVGVLACGLIVENVFKA